jgi:acyl-CoA synthetase (NDP forming)
MTDMKFLFEPQSVAVIGASQDPSKIGYKVLKNIVGGYNSDVYPINPRGGEILGADTFQAASQIEHIEPLLTKDDANKISLWEDLVREHVNLSGI